MYDENRQIRPASFPRDALRASVPFTCSVTGRPFVVHYERRTPAEELCVEAAHPLDAPAGERFGPTTTSQSSVVLAELPSSRVNDLRWACPCCGNSRDHGGSLYIRCGGCGRLVCGATLRTTLDGRQIFRYAPECGRVGTVSGFIESLDASAKSSPNRASSPARPNARKPSPPPVVRALPPSGAKQLPPSQLPG